MQRLFNFRRRKKVPDSELDQVLEVPIVSGGPQAPRLVCRKPFHKINARVRGKPMFFKLRNAWHSLLQLKWWKLFLVLTGIWTLCHLIFGLLFFFEASRNLGAIQNIHDPADRMIWVFFKCFFFSVQSGQTIGYGWWAPLTPYSNTIVTIDAFAFMAFQIAFTGLIVAKLSRPSLMARRIIFSEVAVVSRHIEYYKGGADSLDTGYYSRDGKLFSLQFRVCNAGRTMLAAAQFRLLLLTHTPAGSAPPPSDPPLHSARSIVPFGTSMPSLSPPLPFAAAAAAAVVVPRGKEKARAIPEEAPIEPVTVGHAWKMDELNFDLNGMRGRIRGTCMSTPLLPLPWSITHTIDQWSPLYGLTLRDLEARHAEIIAIVE